MHPPPIRLLIELDPSAEPITGILRQQSGGVSTAFRGWLSLTEALESIRRPGPEPAGQSRDGGAKDAPRGGH